jgi:hypothetical protein
MQFMPCEILSLDLQFSALENPNYRARSLRSLLGLCEVRRSRPRDFSYSKGIIGAMTFKVTVQEVHKTGRSQLDHR